MVLILDGNSEIRTHIWSNLCYLICLRHLIESKSDIFPEKTYFPSCLHTTYSVLPFDISNMVYSYGKGTELGGTYCISKNSGHFLSIVTITKMGKDFLDTQ